MKKKKAGMCLMEKVCLSERPCSSRGHGAAGHEFTVDESIE